MLRLSSSEKKALMEAVSTAYFTYQRVKSPYHRRLAIEYASAMHEVASILEHRKLKGMKAYILEAKKILTEENDGKN